MKNLLFTFGICLTLLPSMAQSDLPFAEIPPAPETYTNGNVAARMVDALGFRYYWATEGLKSEDLRYRPTPESRSMEETLNHILGLSMTIVNAPQGKTNGARADISKMSFEEKRAQTLRNLEKTSQLLKAGNEEDMENYKIIFDRGRRAEFPFWNMINGPIADAIYHTGQVVSFRRISGNPINPKVNVFLGKLNP